jgi:hypothetical protein
MIEVRLNINDMPLDDGPWVYFEWIEARLREAGIPIEGDNLLHGTLIRLDDPENFGAVTYRWVCTKEI